MERGVPRRRRPRPLAAVGVEAVLARSEELAKGWLIALVEDAPLDEAAAIRTGEIARDGPRICDAVVRAMCDEADLQRIEPGGVLEPLVSRAGELAGARSAETRARAVEALGDVVWSAVRSELSQEHYELLADAAERLSLVTGSVRGAVLRHRAEGKAVHDAPWITALREEIMRASRAQSPLSLLLVELDEADRLVAIEPRGEAAAMFTRFAQVVRTALRRRDVLACETEGRAWIIARHTDRAGAQALGSRIVTTVPAEESWRGAPLTVSVGLAVLGEDGDNASALIDAADQMRFAAVASGIGIVSGAGGNGEAGPPVPGPPLAG